MTPDEMLNRLRALKQLEESLKLQRDFEGLIKVHDESMKLFNSVGNLTDRIPQKAYCLARLGRKDEALKTIEELRMHSFFADYDEVYRSVTLVTFFLETSATNLHPVHLNTLRAWLKDAKASKQVIKIVFDYNDIVSDVAAFDTSRLSTSQESFSEELLEYIFVAMGRNEDTMIYYNRELNDVQQHVEGYLSSHLAVDQQAENRRLSNRIINGDDTDPIIEGIHFLIPRLSLVDFLSKFSEHSADFGEIEDFISQFKTDIMVETGQYVDEIDQLVFNDYISQSFYRSLDTWRLHEGFDIELLKEILEQTRRKTSLTFLQSVNGLKRRYRS